MHSKKKAGDTSPAFLRADGETRTPMSHCSLPPQSSVSTISPHPQTLPLTMGDGKGSHIWDICKNLFDFFHLTLIVTGRVYEGRASRASSMLK